MHRLGFELNPDHRRYAKGAPRPTRQAVAPRSSTIPRRLLGLLLVAAVFAAAAVYLWRHR